jgi:hypothetical protein
MFWYGNAIPLQVSKDVTKPKGFLGYLTRGITCLLNIPCHKHYPLII